MTCTRASDAATAPAPERGIALDHTTVAALRAHRAGQQAEQARLGGSYRDSGYLLTGLNGDPMAPDPAVPVLPSALRGRGPAADPLA